MNDAPGPTLDPDRLKAERRDVDLGDAETGHDHASQGAQRDDDRAAADAAIGATPPPR